MSKVSDDFKVEKDWVDRQLEKGLCTKCTQKAVIKYYCQKHREALNKRRSIAYLEEKFKKKYGI